MKDKTVLEGIGVSSRTVESWRRRGLTITYPIKENKKYFKSADGEIYWENADKFVPLMDEKEVSKYKRDPKNFKKDFLRNAKLFRKFVDFVDTKVPETAEMEAQNRLVSLFCLLYLFQRAMDHHYYHWDRYLVYEEFPETPIGYWWQRLKKLYFKATKEKIAQKPNEEFLKVLSGDKKTLKKIRKKLSPKDVDELKNVLGVLMIFAETQEAEVEILTDYKAKQFVLIRTGFKIFEPFWETISKNQRMIKKDKRRNIKKISEMHPIIGARKILLTPNLKCFNREIFQGFEKEILRWT